MSQTFTTDSFTDEYRTAENNGMRQFTRCEHCGYENISSSIGIVYRHRYNLILCDRCTDNFDNVTPWSDKFASERGLPPYPSVMKEVE